MRASPFGNITYLSFEKTKATINQELTIHARFTTRALGKVLPPTLIRFGITLRREPDTRNRLQEALRRVVMNQPALRTSFEPNLFLPPSERERISRTFSNHGIFLPGSYLQVINQCDSIPVAEHDVSTMRIDDRDRLVRDIIIEEEAQDFALDTPLRLRAILIHTTVDTDLVVIFADHLLCDGWSVPIIVNSLEKLLASDRPARGRESSDYGNLEQQHQGFAEFCNSQNSLLATTYFDAALAHWRNQWAQFGAARIGPSNLPFLIKKAGPPTFVFRTEHESLSKIDSDSLRRFARQTRSTLYTIFLTAFAIVLARLTGKSRVAVWTHMINRNNSDAIKTVGWFSNSHLLGIDLTEGASGAGLLEQVKGVVSNAIKFQEVPLQHLWNTLGCTPRYHDAKILLDYRVMPKPNSIFTYPVLPDTPAPRFSSLGLYIVDWHTHVAIRSKFRSDLFDPSGVQQLMKDVISVALQFIHRINVEISAYEMVGKVGRPPLHDGILGQFLITSSELIPTYKGEGLLHPSNRVADNGTIEH